MDVKQAIGVAKHSVDEIFAGEPIIDLGLEEVEFDDNSGIWLITYGFSRPWDDIRPNPLTATFGQGTRKKRDYKIVRISDHDGKLISIKNRETAT